MHFSFFLVLFSNKIYVNFCSLKVKFAFFTSCDFENHSKEKKSKFFKAKKKKYSKMKSYHITEDELSSRIRTFMQLCQIGWTLSRPSIIMGSLFKFFFLPFLQSQKYTYSNALLPPQCSHFYVNFFFISSYFHEIFCFFFSMGEIYCNFRSFFFQPLFSFSSLH